MMPLCRSTSFMHPRQSILHHSLQRHLYTLPHLLFLLFLFFLTSCNNGAASQEKENRTYPLLSKIPDTSFRCTGHAAGYYADPDTGCQVYHMCDTLEKQYSYLCPNHTLFNQKFMVCDHWYMVNCSSSPEFYELNHHIGEVPNSSRGSSAEDNIISTNTVESNGRDNPLKDIKSSSVAVTFKSPLLASAKPRLPSISQIPTNKDPNRPTIHQATTNEPETPFTPTVTERIITKGPNTSFAPTVTHPITAKGPETSFTSKVTQRISTKDPETPFTPTVTQSITAKGQETPFPPTVMEHITTNGSENPFTPTVKQHITTEDPEIPSTPAVTQPITPKNVEVSVSSPVRQLVTNKDPERPVTSPSFTSLPQSPSTNPQLPSIREAITKPITEPSLFLSLPKVGSRHSDSPKVPDTLSTKQDAEVTKKPSNILTTTRNISVSTNTNNSLSSLKGGEAAFNFNLPLDQTPRPSLPFTMMPGSVARRPGSRFVFTSDKDEKLEFSPIDIQGVVFNPFEGQPQSKTRTVLTSIPSVVTPDPHLHVATPKNQETQSAPTESAAPEKSNTFPFQVSFGPHFPTNLQGNQIPSPFLQPPAHDPVSINLAPFIPASQPQSSIPIHRVKQEFPTPLATLVRNGNSQVHIFEKTIPGALHIQFSSSRGNRDFFIPAAGLSLPAQDPPGIDHNSLEEDPDIQVHLHHHNNDGVHMTMVFPALLEAHMVELQLNPQCPRCHPAFLKPGECRPCVLIK